MSEEQDLKEYQDYWRKLCRVTRITSITKLELSEYESWPSCNVDFTDQDGNSFSIDSEAYGPGDEMYAAFKYCMKSEEAHKNALEALSTYIECYTEHDEYLDDEFWDSLNKECVRSLED